MAEQRSDNMTAEMEEEGLTILQKIEDMEVYALPLIERWSIAHQKLLGDDIAHQQSIEIQQQFNKSIAELKEGMDQHQKQLEKIEEDIISRERSKLRDRLLQSHRYFTSPEKNPLHAWSEMEADAFWSMFKEYENAKGNGHMHTVVQPEMRALEVIPMHEDAKIAELMGSRK